MRPGRNPFRGKKARCGDMIPFPINPLFMQPKYIIIISNMQHRIPVLLIFTLIYVFLFSGCPPPEKNEQGGEITIFKYKVVVQGQTAPDLNEIPLYKELEKRTGIRLHFLHPKNDKFEEELDALIESGNIPDLIYIPNENAYKTLLPRYIDSGLVIPLDPLLPHYFPSYNKILSDHPEWEKAIRSSTGKVYMAPFLVGHPSLRVWFGPIVRKDWLNEFGLAEPETIDEWYEMLKAFKSKTPYPLTMAGINKGYKSFVKGNVFIGAYNLCWDFYLDRGKVKFGQYEKNYKDFLLTLKKWYNEQLIDPDFFYNDNSVVDVKISRNEAGVFLGAAGSDLGELLDLKKYENPGFDLTGVKYPVVNKGEKPFTGQMERVFLGRGYCITSGAKNPKLCAQWLDYGYSGEGHILYNFGIEGVSFARVDGEPVYTDLVTHNPEGLTMTQVLSLYTRVTYNSAIVQDEHYLKQFYTWPQCVDAKTKWSFTDAEKHMLPELSLSGSDEKALASIMAAINPYVEKMFISFITGQVSMDHFNDYRTYLENLDMRQAIQIQQDALDRLNS
ncbi:MAG: extracellular solute-binding protein [Spirochaetales bacterium]|nr:extracellular solute-binding protein [Spirochaetales bacterium]